MAVLWFTLYAVFMVTGVTSKPLCLNEGENSSISLESAESSESSSLEETAADLGPLQPAVTDTPNTVEPNSVSTSPLPSADAGQSSVTLNTSALPHQEDPQTSTDIDGSQFMPDDPSLPSMGVDISKDMPDPDAARDFPNADTAPVVPDKDGSLRPGPLEADINAKQPNVTSTHQGSATTAPPPKLFSTAAPLTLPTGTIDALCCTVQFTTPAPPPLRGDNK